MNLTTRMCSLIIGIQLHHCLVGRELNFIQVFCFVFLMFVTAIIDHDTSDDFTDVVPHADVFIDKWTFIIRLELHDRYLACLPESIGKLTNLVDLDVYKNDLSHLPDSIGNLTSLVDLNVSRNELTSLPDSMRNLSSL